MATDTDTAVTAAYRAYESLHKPGNVCEYHRWSIHELLGEGQRYLLLLNLYPSGKVIEIWISRSSWEAVSHDTVQKVPYTFLLLFLELSLSLWPWDSLLTSQQETKNFSSWKTSHLGVRRPLETLQRYSPRYLKCILLRLHFFSGSYTRNPHQQMWTIGLQCQNCPCPQLPFQDLSFISPFTTDLYTLNLGCSQGSSQLCLNTTLSSNV